MFIICGPKVPASISLNLLTSATSCKCCALANGDLAATLTSLPFTLGNSILPVVIIF